MSEPIIHECAQGELEWHQLHLGRATASELKNILKLDGTLRKGDMLESYINRKVAAKWQGHALPSFGSKAVENGIEWEQQARNWLEFSKGLTVQQVGFIESGRMGCSPDGLIGDDEGLEIKCPNAETHVGYIREGGLPDEYKMQVHGSLWISGRARWHFLSYRGRFPKFHIIVERDEALYAKMAEAMEQFWKLYDAAWNAVQTLEDNE